MTFNSKPLTDIVHIQLGSASFFVYSEFLTWHCPLLVRACGTELGKPVVPEMLEDVDFDVFGLFVNYSYIEQVVNKLNQPPYQHRTIGLWILAKRLQMPTLANAAIGALAERQKLGERNQVKTFRYVYGKTIKCDQLPRYLVDV